MGISNDNIYILHLQQRHNDNEGGRFCSRKKHIKYTILFIQFHLQEKKKSKLPSTAARISVAKISTAASASAVSPACQVISVNFTG
jgi:hypothetical protein